MAIQIEQAQCPNCEEIIDFCNGEEVVFCPVCEDNVFTQHYRISQSDFISDDYHGYTMGDYYV